MTLRIALTARDRSGALTGGGIFIYSGSSRLIYFEINLISKEISQAKPEYKATTTSIDILDPSMPARQCLCENNGVILLYRLYSVLSNCNLPIHGSFAKIDEDSSAVYQMNYGFSSQGPTNETQKAGEDKTTADPAMGETHEDAFKNIFADVFK